MVTDRWSIIVGCHHMCSVGQHNVTTGAGKERQAALNAYAEQE